MLKMIPLENQMSLSFPILFKELDGVYKLKLRNEKYIQVEKLEKNFSHNVFKKYNTYKPIIILFIDDEKTFIAVDKTSNEICKETIGNNFKDKHTKVFFEKSFYKYCDEKVYGHKETILYTDGNKPFTSKHSLSEFYTDDDFIKSDHIFTRDVYYLNDLLFIINQHSSLNDSNKKTLKFILDGETYKSFKSVDFNDYNHGTYHDDYNDFEEFENGEDEYGNPWYSNVYKGYLSDDDPENIKY